MPNRASAWCRKRRRRPACRWTTALIYGSPATVAEKMAEIDATGVGGVIMLLPARPDAGGGGAGLDPALHDPVAPEFQGGPAGAAE